MSVFDRYAPFVQDFIYRNRWDNLRAIQVAAGEAIFNTDQNVLLCASTASYLMPLRIIPFSILPAILSIYYLTLFLLCSYNVLSEYPLPSALGVVALYLLHHELASERIVVGL